MSAKVTYLSPEELRQRWGFKVSLRTLEEWRKRKTGPAYVKLGARIYYPLDFVQEYETENTVIPKE